MYAWWNGFLKTNSTIPTESFVKMHRLRMGGEKGSFYVSVELPTYPSPKPTLTLRSYLEQNVGSGEW